MNVIALGQAPHPEVYDQTAGLVSTSFFDPGFNGVNWIGAVARHRRAAERAGHQEELSDVINELLAELKTSHTYHFTPSDIEYFHLLDIFPHAREAAGLPQDAAQYEGLSAFFSTVGGRTFISSLWAGGEAEQAGLRIGDEIVSVEGEPFSPVDSFRGRAGERVQMTIRRKEGYELLHGKVKVERIKPKAALLRAMSRSVRVFERDGRRIGYICIYSYAGDDYHKVLIDQITSGQLAGSDALLIDLRPGFGGASPEYLAPFLPAPVMTMQGRGEGPRLVSDFRWNRPVGLLIDERSRSGKEVLAHGFRSLKLGPLIGETTAGAVVGGTAFMLADDSMLFLAVADVEVDGQRLEGKGVRPTIEVPFDIPYSNGEDPQLERGLDVLAEMAAESDQPRLPQRRPSRPL